MSARPIPSALAAAAEISAGRLTAEALMERCLAVVAEREPVLRAWAHLDADAALRAARQSDREGGDRPLRGLPLGVKDLIDTADMPTAYGSPIYAGHRPARDAACVALARTAGAILPGKTVTTEFAYFAPGPTTNPHNPGHTPGGSSSGSAAAVAAGMLPFALGTQTAGSIIRPAAFCGCVGYKPSFGLLDVTGIRPFAISLDTLGVLAADVADAAFLAAVLANRPRLRIGDRGLPVPAIGVARTYDWERASPSMQARLEEVAALCAAGGARLCGLSMPGIFSGLGQAQMTTMAFEAARSTHAEMRTAPQLLSAKMQDLAERGMAVSAEDYDNARWAAQQGRVALADAMAEVDLLLTPAAPGEAPAGLAATGDPVFNRIWTLLGSPAVSLPAGLGPNGLPLAVQLVGRPGRDAQLLQAAAWVERRLADRFT